MIGKRVVSFGSHRNRNGSLRRLAILMLGLCVLFTGQASALTITGTVSTSGKYLVSGSPAMTAKLPALLKISFENNTGGTNLTLCAGTDTDFAAGKCGMLLASSGGPGFRFLALVDAADLNGKVIYVFRSVGSAASTFNLTIE